MNLEFDEQGGEDVKRILYAKFQQSSKTPSVLSFLVKIHLAKDERRATILIISIVIIAFLISIYLLVGTVNGPVFIDR